MREIIKRATHIAITDYFPVRCPALESIFSYRKNFNNYTVGIDFNKKENELRIFGGVSIGLIKYAIGKDTPYREEFEFDKPNKISTRLQVTPRDQLQRDMIQFLINAGNWESNYNHTQISCNTETDSGKTFAAIAMISFMRVKTIIIVNRRNIKSIWLREIRKFTDMDEKRMLVLTHEIMNNIIDDKFDTDQYHIFIVVHRSLNQFANDRGWEKVGELFKKIGIGLKIFDEAHREFTNTTHIECNTNTQKTLYLTATLKLSDPSANRIFQNLFRDIPKFDQMKLGYTEHKKHINMIAYFYDSNPTNEHIKSCKFTSGFSAVQHSMYQITEDPYFFSILRDLVDKFTISKYYRTLILVSRIVACEEIKDHLQGSFPELSIGVYNSEINDKEKERVFENDHLIISTNRSLGEAVTIKNLQVVINCEAHVNYGDQASGRLRKFDKDATYIYCELIDKGFPSIRNQWKTRKRNYAEKFGKIIEIQT